jgi:DNA polymerase-4
VQAASAEARANGVVEGMALSQAEQCCPEAVFLPVDREAAAAVQRVLLSTLYALTPEVSTDAEGLAFIQLDGMALSWPDRRRLVEAITQRIASALDVVPEIGLGVNLFVSKLAAVSACPGKPVVVEPMDTVTFLKPQSIDALPLEDDVREYLGLLGIRTVGALTSISRTAFRRQFGVKAMPAYDMACGNDARPLTPWRPPARIEAGMPLDPPVDDTQALQFVARALTDRISEGLRAQGLGTRLVLIRLDQVDASPIQVSARFTYPLTAASDLFDRIRPRVLRARITAPLERITLLARRLGPAHVRQPGLLVRRDGFRESLADAVLRLQEEFRPDLVQRAGLAMGVAPLPGKRIRWRPA